MRLVSSVASIHLDFFNLTYVHLIVQWQENDADELVIVLGYFTFLSILTVVKYREDPSVMQCRTHRFPLVYERRSLKSAPTSPSQPRFRNQSAPVIAAPRPQRIAQLREAVLSRRSSLSLEYEVEHFSGGPTLPTAQPTSPDDFAPQFGRATSLDVQSSDPHATSSDGHTFAIHIPQPMVALPPLVPVRSPSQSAPRATYTPSPFYHSSVETAIRGKQPANTAACPAQLGACAPTAHVAAITAAIRRLAPYGRHLAAAHEAETAATTAARDSATSASGVAALAAALTQPRRACARARPVTSSARIAAAARQGLRNQISTRSTRRRSLPHCSHSRNKTPARGGRQNRVGRAGSPSKTGGLRLLI